MKTNKELVIEFAKAWNNLDASYVYDLLAEDFHYASQWVFAEIENKTDYLEYLEGKFKAIKSSDSNVTAELGQYDNDYCLVVAQDSNNHTTFIIKTEEGVMKRADMCMVPTIREIKRLDIYPN